MFGFTFEFAAKKAPVKKPVLFLFQKTRSGDSNPNLIHAPGGRGFCEPPRGSNPSLAANEEKSDTDSEIVLAGSLVLPAVLLLKYYYMVLCARGSPNFETPIEPFLRERYLYCLHAV